MLYLNLNELLEKNHKSKYWLVNKLNSNYSVVNKMLNGETTQIKFETIEKLMKIFDCTLEELIKRK